MSDLPPSDVFDCVIVGGGPAGLTAAIYLARFHLSVVVMDGLESRAASIPLTRNHAGFPEGISGLDLLARMREQARQYGADVRTGIVTQLFCLPDGFEVQVGRQRLHARAVLLATGVVNRRPEMMEAAEHDAALATGRLRYCPVCDGFEVTDQRVAVLGTGERGRDEALFLRSFTRHVTLVAPSGGHELSSRHRADLADAGIAVMGICQEVALKAEGVALRIDNRWETFDSLYPALGSDVRSQLASALGAKCTGEGCLVVDMHQRTSVEGLYAAGDVVLGLDQISHAMGEGGVAATTIRNDLALKQPLRR